MIEDQEVTHDGKRYAWVYDESIDSPLECWGWSDDRYMSAPQGLIGVLNRQFIGSCAADVVAMLDDVEAARFCRILKAMGATDYEISAVGLESVLSEAFPEKAPSEFVEEMPPAAHLPFNSAVLRDWLFHESPFATNPPKSVSCIGNGPFDIDDFAGFLANHDVSCVPVDDSISVFILGREDWSENEIDDLIDIRVGQCLRIYSQEMFVAFLAKRSDPFYAAPDVLEAFKAGHEGLEFVSSGWSGWVTTYVAENRYSDGFQRVDTAGWVKESPLHVLGYRVGKSGEPTTTRHRVLRQAFSQELPIVGPALYMAEWDQPETPGRLKKMAESLASHCRNQRMKQKPAEKAIEDWESDLEWLREEFYHGRFRFHWPATYV